jgi:hypothetical protein
VEAEVIGEQLSGARDVAGGESLEVGAEDLSS